MSFLFRQKIIKDVPFLPGPPPPQHHKSDVGGLSIQFPNFIERGTNSTIQALKMPNFIGREDHSVIQEVTWPNWIVREQPVQQRKDVRASRESEGGGGVDQSVVDQLVDDFERVVTDIHGQLTSSQAMEQALIENIEAHQQDEARLRERISGEPERVEEAVRASQAELEEMTQARNRIFRHFDEQVRRVDQLQQQLRGERLVTQYQADALNDEIRELHDQIARLEAVPIQDDNPRRATNEAVAAYRDMTGNLERINARMRELVERRRRRQQAEVENEEMLEEDEEEFFDAVEDVEEGVEPQQQEPLNIRLGNQLDSTREALDQLYDGDVVDPARFNGLIERGRIINERARRFGLPARDLSPADVMQSVAPFRSLAPQSMMQNLLDQLENDQRFGNLQEDLGDALDSPVRQIRRALQAGSYQRPEQLNNYINVFLRRNDGIIDVANESTFDIHNPNSGLKLSTEGKNQLRDRGFTMTRRGLIMTVEYAYEVWEDRSLEGVIQEAAHTAPLLIS